MTKKSKGTQQIQGEFMRPVFNSIKDFENGYKQSHFWAEKDFYNTYREHIVAMEHISICAKLYILKNYKKIQDWSNLNVTIVSKQTQECTEYFKYVKSKPTKRDSPTVEKLWRNMDTINKKKHNPIVTLSDVVLDPSDGDFSLKINEIEYLWINDESVILIAQYIEEQLKLK